MFMFSDFTYKQVLVRFAEIQSKSHKSKQKDLSNNFKKGEPGEPNHFTYKKIPVSNETYVSQCLLLAAVAKAQLEAVTTVTCGLLEPVEKIGLNCLNGSPEITLNDDPLQVL